jgi:hypothetical protein
LPLRGARQQPRQQRGQCRGTASRMVYVPGHGKRRI